MSEEPKDYRYGTGRVLWMSEKLSLNAKGMWHILMGHADKTTKECYPTIRHLRKVSGLGRHAVASALKELEKAGCIKKRVERRRNKFGFEGSKAFYTVKDAHTWICEEFKLMGITNKPGVSFPDTSGSGSTRNLPQTPVLHDKHNTSMKETPPQAPQAGLGVGSPLRKTLEDTEALLADRGFDASIASDVWEKMERRAWLDDDHLPFRDVRALEKFMLGLAQTIYSKKHGHD